MKTPETTGALMGELRVVLDQLQRLADTTDTPDRRLVFEMLGRIGMAQVHVSRVGGVTGYVIAKQGPR
jgi:hypothetical protein